jgi:hypothetical protein
MSKDKPAPEKRPDIKDRAEKEKDAETMDEKGKAKSKVPDPPACDPALGDLTPAYIEWVKKYYPDDFERAATKGRIPSSGGRQGIAMSSTPGSETHKSVENAETLPRSTMPSESAVPPAVVQGEDWPEKGPVLEGLNPDSLAVQGPSAYIVLHGTGFTEESVVIWDEDEMPAEYVNPGKLRLFVVPPTEEEQEDMELPHEITVAVQDGNQISNTLLFAFIEPEVETEAEGRHAKIRPNRKRKDS